jgi:hypothetical protein
LRNPNELGQITFPDDLPLRDPLDCGAEDRLIALNSLVIGLHHDHAGDQDRDNQRQDRNQTQQLAALPTRWQEDAAALGRLGPWC